MDNIESQSVKSLVLTLVKKGVSLSVADGKLKLTGPVSTLSSALKAQIKDNKQAIIDYVQTVHLQQTKPKITRIDNTQPAPLSYVQQQLYFIDQYQEQSAQYNMPAAFKLEGPLDIALAEQAIKHILLRHQVLRTVYQKGAPAGQFDVIQQVQAEPEFVLKDINLRHLPESEQQQQLHALLEQDIQTPFCLHTDLLLRASHISICDHGQPCAVLLFNMHHIAGDGWSMELLLKEFVIHYQSLATQGCISAASLPTLPIQYRDYAHWQRQYLSGEVLQQKLNYWQTQLAGIEPEHSIPLDVERSASQSTQPHAKRITTKLSGDTASRLQALAKSFDLTPFMLLYGAVCAAIARFSNTEDVVIGSPVANRTESELENLIGCFINSIVLRVNTASSSISEYLSQVRTVHLDALKHQDLPFSLLVESLELERNPEIHPVFQIMFSTNTDFGVKNEHVKKENDELVPGVKLSPIAPPVNIAKFDLDIAASVSGSEIAFSWLYNSAIFSPQKIQRIAQHTQLWLTRLADLDEAQCATYSTDVLNALSEEEENKLLTTLQPSRDIPEPPSSLLHECVTIQAQKTPDDTALVNINSAGEENSLSYEQLTNYSNSLARYLIAHGVKPDMRVALFSNNSLELIVSILAILKAGGAYLAIDPSTPEDRLEYILADADVSIVLTQTTLQHRLPSAVSMTLNVDSTLISKVLETYSTEPVSTAENTLNPHNLAYTIYTSGSTGKPKGVLVEHHAISTHIAQISHAYQIQPRQRILSFPSISFDVSIELMFSSLCSGATLYLKDNAIWTANQFYEYLLSHQIHSVDVAPAYLAELLIESEASLQFWQNTQLRLLLVGGEAFPQNLRDKWFQIADKTGIDGRCRLLNAYGPTECLITSTLHEITRSDGIIPIGQGVGSRRLYVLDEHHRLLPEGAVGELYVSGPLNARGYLNRPDLTEQRFLADPFTQDDQDTMYQTGDLVRWLPQGELEYLGRVDEQVKIRGFRIELGEIANTLMQIAQVDSVEVLAIETKSGQKQLVAFVKQSHPGSLSEAQMRDTLQHALSQTLPHYMVPSAYSFIEEWPTTTSGKVDKKQLRHTFKLTATTMFEDEGPYVAPTTPLEQQLVEIWSEVLTQPAEQISIHANFFALGGHSLLTMRLISQIHQACHLELNVKEVFNHPTIAEQAKLLALKTPSDDTKIPALPRNVHGDVLSFSQHRLWFINQLRGQTSEYNMPSAFILKGQIEPALLERALNLVIQRHEVLHTVYRQSEGVAKQHVMTEYEFQLTQIDLSSLDEAHQQQRLLALAQQDANTPFDLSAGPIIRASFVALHKAQHQSITSGALLLNMHHIASDGWSMSILLRELTQYYIALLDNSAQPETVIPPLPIQYADYAIWQRAHFDETVLQEQLSYWQTQLSDLPEMHSLPLKAERPEVKQSQADIVSCDLSQSLCKNLSQLAHHHGMTPFMLLHSALAQVLSMHSGSDDIVIGTVTAGRQPAVEQLIGFFINTLVLRVNTGAHNTGHLRDYLSHVKDVHTQAQANQDVPFEQLVEKLQPQRDAAYTPLFQIVLTTDADFLTTQNASYSSHPSVQIEPMTTNDIRLKFDIELNMSMNTAGGKVTWLYDCHLFDKSYIEKINAHLCHYLSALAELVDGEHVIDKPLNELTMLSQAEQHHALSVLNGPIRDYPL
ncbi:amino acid adenylation domain-containing protein, partial [Pseudoalteromonas luteoviolacea]|uniref:non-ribosomal peptide synthetase n=1 Tax=Pseudoalteromonas luteoviolacea TaxID=43657 RepID=UPI001B38FC50